MTPAGFEPAIQQARATADPRLRPRGDRDRHCFEIHFTIILPLESRWPKDFKFRYKVGRFFFYFKVCRAVIPNRGSAVPWGTANTS